MLSKTFRLALIACGVCSTSAFAGFTFSGFGPSSWNASDATLGFNCPIVESFEAVQLVPNLSVAWIAGAGTIGPVTTLPKTFNPSLEDTLFAPSVWAGQCSLISGYGNSTQVYSDSSKWGNVEFTIAGGTTDFGIAIQQMDIANQVAVNSVNYGSIATLTGGAFALTGGRNGFLKISGNAGSVINKVRFINVSGDGFAFDHLLFSGTPVATVVGYPLAIWGSSDSLFGMSGAEVEDFDDKTLEPGLSITWDSTNGKVGPVTSLPNLFDPHDDAFGNAFVGGAWGGKRGIINTRTNQTFAYSAKANWGNIKLDFSPAVRSVGMSIHQMELPATIYVNGKKIGTTPELPCSPVFQLGSGRNGYLVFTQGSEPISSIQIDPGYVSAYTDGFMIDYLTFKRDGDTFGGKLDLESYVGANPGIFTFEFRRASDNVLVATVNEKVSGTGDFGFASSLPAGNYNVTVKGGTFLRKTVNGVDLPTVLFGATLLNGDCDGSNYVGTDDYLILNQAFDTSLGEAGFDARADLDGSESVGTDDYLILNKNFDTGGN